MRVKIGGGHKGCVKTICLFDEHRVAAARTHQWRWFLMASGNHGFVDGQNLDIVYRFADGHCSD